MPITIPIPAPQAAEEIKAVGVEGRPADPTGGPGRLLLEMALGACIVIAFGVGFGLWLGWAVGIAVLALGAVGLAFNPVMGAVAARAKDRKEVADQHAPNVPTPDSSR